MASNKHELKIATFEDGTCAVLRTDPTKPRHPEVIATFYDVAHARDYVRLGNTSSGEHREERPIVNQPAKSKPKQSSKAQPKPTSVAKFKAAHVAKPNQASVTKPKRAPEAKATNAATDMSERQTAVLKALRSLMDKKHRVEVRGAELAKAASIPLGSVHSVVASLEKKRMIRTERQGSALLRPIYEVLETSRKRAPSTNGAAHGKAAHTAIRAH
jgi:uncharacterized membrane protein